jgi:hypothetical protein
MPCYDPRDSSENVRAEALESFTHNSPVAEMLCAVMKRISPENRLVLGKEISGLTQWWTDHQARDAKKEANEPKALGYRVDGKAIYPIKEGMIATAAIVSCTNCHKIIRGMGGPIRGAVCLDCWEGK